MHIRVRAPLLSAALSIVWSWIMLASPSATGGLLDHLDQAPRLVSRHRPARRDGHEVADMGLTVLIVSEELGRTPHVLAVRGVLDQPRDLHGDRLLHLVAHHAPGQRAQAFLMACSHLLCRFAA